MRYSRRTLNYPGTIALSVLTHVISIADHVAIGVERPRIESGCSLEKDFTELICMNHLMVLYPTIDQFYSCYNCVRGLLT